MINQLGRMDIYLLDQLMKGRIAADAKILDAGCGIGRNSEYFIRDDFDISGVDLDSQAIQGLKEQIPNWNARFDVDRFVAADLIEIPFLKHTLDYIISSAVLHFSTDRAHFTKMFEELVRVLKPGGILFIRMTTESLFKKFSFA